MAYLSNTFLYKYLYIYICDGWPHPPAIWWSPALKRKASNASYLDEIIYFKAVDISYKDFLLQSTPLS